MHTRKRLFLTLWLVLLVLLFAMGGLAQKKSKNRNDEQVPQSNPPTIRLTPSTNVVTNCPGQNSVVTLVADAKSPQGLPLVYKWDATGGNLNSGDPKDPQRTWDFTGARAGTYTVTVEVNSGREQDCTAFTQTAVEVRDCQITCPSIVISCPNTSPVGQAITFRANVTNIPMAISPVYNWTVTAGTITSGQGTQTITVDTTGIEGRPVTANLSVAGFNLDCTAQCTAQIPFNPKCRPFDQFGDIARDDEKARLDNFAIQLQQEPESTGYIFIYTGTGRRIRPDYVQRRTARISDYLFNTRGVDRRRIVIIEGSPRSEPTVMLWVAPAGVTCPTP